MRFYRGLAVPDAEVATVIADIQDNGLQVRESGWRMIAQDLKPHLGRIWSLPAIQRSDVTLLPDDATTPKVCACADRMSALFYACRKNATATNSSSILVSFDADVSDAIVDGRDLLYTVFQMGDPERARPVLERAFGKAILPYAERAWSTATNDNQRISICDLAVQDDGVIRAHARNTAVMAGRADTEFCSAFMVRLPVPSDRIEAVEQVFAGDRSFPATEISLRSLVQRG